MAIGKLTTNPSFTISNIHSVNIDNASLYSLQIVYYINSQYALYKFIPRASGQYDITFNTTEQNLLASKFTGISSNLYISVRSFLGADPRCR